jgi:drug/metabolite transporter (DMT)-like permease
MNKKAIRADLMLLLTSIVWGFAFVAQRVGMEHIGPFAFNGIRFALGSLSLLPLIRFLGRRERSARRETPTSGAPTNFHGSAMRQGIATSRRLLILGSLAAGAVLFIAASLQQVGIQYTTAGKAGFLTGLYVVLVPIAESRWGTRPDSPRGSGGARRGGHVRAERAGQSR